MTMVDAVVIVLLIGAAISGFRQGLITATLALVGAVAGAVLGIRLAPVPMQWVDDSAAKVAIGIAMVVLGVGLGEWGGSALGRLLANRVTWRPARAVDRGLGLVGYTLAVLVVAWMVALPLAATSIQWLSSAVRGSTVLRGVDTVMPAGMRDVSGNLGQLFNDSGFPAILEPLGRTPVANVPAPDPALTRSPVVAAARPSILKVRTRAESCARRLEGTGFVIGDDRVMTNAHVVAGGSEVAVEVGDDTLPATVVLYDSRTDLAVLHVPGLNRPAMEFSDTPAESGDDAIVAGFPLDGPFTAVSARVRGSLQLRGPDIYGAEEVVREVYTLNAAVRAGNSGGPLLDTDGKVIGVIFGAAPDATDVGYALTAAEVAPVLQAGLADTTADATGSCLAD